MNTKNIKIYTLFAIIAMLGFTAMAQTKPKHVLAIAADKMNVLYAGYPNPVSVAVSSVSPKKLRIDWGGAEATYQSKGRYVVDVPLSLAGRELVVTVRKGKNQLIGRYCFRVKAVPEPIVFVGGNITAGCHHKDVILVNPFISARWSPDFNVNAPWRAVSYNVTFVINNIVYPPIFVEGPRFSEEVKNKIIEAPSGTVIAFSDIKIQSIAGKYNIQNPIVIRIEDDCDKNKSENP